MTAKDAPAPSLALLSSRNFVGWLAEVGASLAFTTYQGGKVFLVGRREDRLAVTERTLSRCMGMAAVGPSLYISSRYQLWRFEDALRPGESYQDCDRLYVPQVGYTTGDLDIHDIAVDADGRIIFVNTLFSCLATVSETHSFRPLWKPSFISRLAAEDRCHLNGLALDEQGVPRYVTAVAESDVAAGWRTERRDGGILVDVRANEVVAGGLSMPHSPRVHRGRVWLHNSGSGELGTVDLDTGRFEPVAFCPGYLRGLAFIGEYAVVGLSRTRKNPSFAELALQDALNARKAEARCALFVIDLRSGDAVQWLDIEGLIEELYDVVVLPGVARPSILGFKSDEIHRTITVGEPAAFTYSVRPA